MKSNFSLLTVFIFVYIFDIHTSQDAAETPVAEVGTPPTPTPSPDGGSPVEGDASKNVDDPAKIKKEGDEEGDDDEEEEENPDKKIDGKPADDKKPGDQKADSKEASDKKTAAKKLEGEKTDATKSETGNGTPVTPTVSNDVVYTVLGGIMGTYHDEVYFLDKEKKQIVENPSSATKELQVLIAAPPGLSAQLQAAFKDNKVGKKVGIETIKALPAEVKKEDDKKTKEKPEDDKKEDDKKEDGGKKEEDGKKEEIPKKDTKDHKKEAGAKGSAKKSAAKKPVKKSTLW